jgi:outer membrane protein assembly factor BamB
MSSPALASDGTIYIYALIGTSNKLFSVRAGGGTNWIYTMAGLVVSGPASVQFPSPAIGPDGTIYAGTLGGQLYAVSPAGRTNWVITLGNETYSSPAVGPDGTIYLGCDDGKVYAVDWRGFPKWTYDTGGFVECSASVSSGGAIFIGSLSGTFYQFTAQGVPQWLVNNGFVSASPALASDGSIYFASSSALYAYSSAHALLWSFSGSGLFFSSPTIGADGTVYVGSGTKLYALYGTNTLQNSSWAMFRREVTHQARSIQRGIRPPALAPDGTAALTLTVETGRTYAVEASTNLLNWTALTNFVSASLTNVVVDATAGNFRARFYRLRTP